MGETAAAGTTWSKVDICECREIIAVFEPRPTEARTFIFLYDLTPMLLKWPEENSKRAAPRR